MKRSNENNDVGNEPNEQVVQQAFHWAVMLEDEACPLSQRKAFVRWLKKSPEHIDEFFAVTATWESLDNIKHLNKEAIDTLLQELDIEHEGNSVSNTSPSNIVRIDSRVQTQDFDKGRRANPRASRWLNSTLARPVSAIAGVVAVAALALMFYGREPNEFIYATTTGEQRSWTLEDGSILHLNTLSRLKISYSAQRRLIELLAGEALFDVAHDAARPFYVRTEDAVVRAVGTSFNVYRSDNREDATVVTVVEGKVAIASARPANSDTEYKASAGDQLTITPSGEITRKSVLREIDTATAWRQRKLVFRSTPLHEVVNEFNRYNRQKIVITSETAKSRDITGVFDADKPGDLLTFLENDKSVKLIKMYDRVIIADASF